MLKSLDDITIEVLNGIEQMAKCFFVPEEIALALEMDINFMKEQMEDYSSTVYRAYHKGWIQSEFEQRQCIFSLALSGSSPAQTMVNGIRDRAKLKLMN